MDSDLQDLFAARRMGDKSPADRGSADRYYGRVAKPHKYVSHERITDLIPAERIDYLTAYENETDRKDYGYED